MDGECDTSVRAGHFFFLVGCLVYWHINICWLFNAKSIFYTNNQLYFKQFSLVFVYSLILKNISISSYSVYSNSSNSAKYKYIFCFHTIKCQNNSILNNSV